jgi:hypothetical protein
MSPTGLVAGTAAVKSLLMRSGREAASAAGIVVRFFARGWMPDTPSSRMHLRTRYSVAPAPSAKRSSWMRLTP